MLSDVEVMVGFLATTIATYRPLYRRIFQGTGYFNAGYSANKRSAFADAVYNRQDLREPKSRIAEW